MTEKLKPCPFCGGEAQIFHTPELLAMKETGYHAVCLNCGATLPEEKMPFIAMQEWNTRVGNLLARIDGKENSHE